MTPVAWPEHEMPRHGLAARFTGESNFPRVRPASGVTCWAWHFNVFAVHLCLERIDDWFLHGGRRAYL
jgi:hypothetical protein